MPTAPFIQLLNVSKHYTTGGVGLTNVSCEIEKGEMVFVTGHSGAGKTTFLRLVATLEWPSQGQILVNQKNISRLRTYDIPAYRQRIGLIFQDYKLLYDRSVFDNVAIPLIASGTSRLEVKKRVGSTLEQVGLGNKETRNPRTLSGGEQQRVGIARAIVNQPRLLLADEPTGNLDPAMSKDIMDLFVRLNQAGTTILVASHAPALVQDYAQRAIELSDGHLVKHHEL